MNTYNTDRRPREIAARFFSALVIGLVGAGIANSAFAQSTWTGGDVDDSNWTSGDNWGGTAPTPGTGTDLIFDGSTRTVNTNDFVADSDFRHFTFAETADAFTLQGNSLTLNGWIYVNNDNSQTFDMDLNLSSVQHNILDANNDSTFETVVFNGAVNYGGGRLFPNTWNADITLNGAGTGAGQNSTAWTVTGPSTFRANNVTYLEINNDSALGTGWFQVNADTYISSGGSVNLGNAFVIGNGRLRFDGGDVEISGGTVTGSSGAATAGIVAAGNNREIGMYHTGTTTISGDVYLADSDTGRTLTTYFNQNGTLEISGDVHNNLANIGGGGVASSIYKNGTGTLVLSGNNTYGGNTTVASGALLMNGIHNQGTGANAGRYIVNAAGTLGGTGTIMLSDTDAGTTGISIVGTLAPGDGGVGALTVDGLNSVRSAMAFETGATIQYDLDAGLSSDQLTLVDAQANDILFNDNMINFTDLTSGSLADGAYLLFDLDADNGYSGLTTDGGGFITAGLSVGTGLESYSPSLQIVGQDIYLNVAAVPEPSTFGLAGLGLLLLWNRRRNACR